MSEIDTKDWVEFRIGDLFEVINGRKYPMTWRVLGEIPLVSTSSLNNGISDLVGFPKGSDYEEHEGVITIAYSGSVGATFYHEGSVFIGETVMGLVPRDGVDLSKGAGTFVCSVIERVIRDSYTYVEKVKLSDVRDKLTIKLPATADGDPDWDWMAAEMERRLQDSEAALSALLSVSQHEPEIVDTSQWGEFRVGDLFDVVKGSRLKSVDRLDGDIPYIGATMFDNGVVQYIENDENVHEGGLLTVCYDGPVGTTFYQPERFWVTDSANVLYPKFDMSEAMGLFLVPVIQEVGSKYAYVDKWKMEDMKNAILTLPAMSNGDPDWTTMESVMKQRIEIAEEALKVLVG